jgi:uncharacterized protein YceH (UPF0502 family)
MIKQRFDSFEQNLASEFSKLQLQTMNVNILSSLLYKYNIHVHELKIKSTYYV